MDWPDSTRTDGRSSPQRPRRAVPGRPPRRPTGHAPRPGSAGQPPWQPSWLPFSALVRGLPATVGAVGLAFFVVQAALGWGLGVAGAGLTVLVAAMLLAVLVFTDAMRGKLDGHDDKAAPYDLAVCGAVAGTVAVAIACLYLPMPWGGLCAAVVLVGLVVTLYLR
jgi:hypothetical protein